MRRTRSNHSDWRHFCASLALLISLLALVTPCRAHQSVFERPDSAELAKTQPPLAGSEEFARTLLRRLKGQFDPDQFALLDQLEKNLNQADRIRWGFDAGVSQDVADYFRWRAESELMKLLAAYKGSRSKSIFAQELKFQVQRFLCDCCLRIELSY